ncbi:MAG: glutamine--fructose-6-phosphate transaminase (isomerizing), partial [Intestinibacter sp.]|uniref:glutamine--fructose-6-phosphate transaminase (isomerizing) n=1 Tax=Intestinibacter sp. TaxID=1965304 RepID=UPI003F189DE6
MCGIVGYLGNRQATDVLVDGLSKLEYRGYDSAGVAVNNGKDNLEIRKFQGRLAVLAEDLQKSPIEGHLGIGHTRWATHGVPSDENAHPHFNEDKTIAVVHNGIIENYLELRAELQAEGYHFVSQTDTEVAAHMISKYYQGDLLDAVYKATARFRGAYALGVICTDNDKELVAVRKDSPLIVGLGDGENFIASDIPAVLKYTRKVYYLENGEYVHITEDKVQVLNENREVVDKKVNEITWDVEAASKGGYDHFMIKEIYEQPEGTKNTLMRRLDENGEIKLDDIDITKEQLDKINKIYIVACGTAYNAGLVGAHAVQRFLKVPVVTDIASEFRYSDPFIDENTLVILASQSGETADTLSVLREAKAKGATVLSIANVVGSSIARESDYTLYTWAGPEIAVASTKAYTTQIVAFIMIALDFAYKKGTITKEEYMSYIEELKLIPDQVAEVLKCEDQVKEIAKQLVDKKDVFYLGRGLDYSTAMEGALKIKEISYTHAEAFAAGELKHGTIALIEEGVPVVVLATQQNLFEKMLSNMQEVKARGAYVISVTEQGNSEVEKSSDAVIYIPKVDNILAGILSVIPLQLLAYYVAKDRGCDIDKPRNLAKSVTVE